MTKTIKINVSELDTQWLTEMQAQHQAAELEIKVLEEEQASFSEAQFWSIISTFDWSKGEDTNAIIAPAIEHLKQFDETTLFKFQDLLAEKLYALDQAIFAKNIGERSYGIAKHFSVDGFLYSRAGVVANGKDFYERVLQQPEKMPKEFTFEALLYLAPTAYEIRTGKAWTYLPEPSYETYSNSTAWGGKIGKTNSRFSKKIDPLRG